jgi:hypothetical protein
MSESHRESPVDDRRPYPGDFHGSPQLEYRPHPDGDADPGEIVWTWVPYEEDHTQGKDRPVMIIGHDRDWLIGLMLTSQDHGQVNGAERIDGRVWCDIGTGPWDPQGRPSEVRLDRILRVDPTRVRREGAGIDLHRFTEVAKRLRHWHQPR